MDDPKPAMDDPTTADISRQMEDVRSDLGDDVEELVESARTLTDWRHYVKQFPWACVGGAMALGFFIVPKRIELISPDADALEQLAKRNKLVVKSNPKPQAKSGVSGALFTFLATSLGRGAMAYVGHNIGKVLGSSAAENDQDGENQ